MTRYTVFSKSEDIFLHFIAILIALVIISALITTPTTYWMFKIMPVNTFISGVFFFNSIHYYFAFLMAAMLPEYRVPLRTNKIKLLDLVVRFGIFIMFFYFWKRSEQVSTFFKISTIIFLGYPKYHSLRQINGLWIIFTSKANISHSKLRQLDQLALKFLLVGAIVNYTYLLKFLPFFFVKCTFLGLYALFILTFLKSLFHLPREYRFHKTLYGIRQFGSVLCMYDPLASFLFHCLHGLEYAFTTKKMVINSSHRNKNKKIITSFILFSLMVVPICILIHHTGAINIIWGIKIFQLSLFQKIAVVDLSIQFIHYSLDGKMFEMKHEDVRSEIAPLLV